MPGNKMRLFSNDSLRKKTFENRNPTKLMQLRDRIGKEYWKNPTQIPKEIDLESKEVCFEIKRGRKVSLSISEVKRTERAEEEERERKIKKWNNNKTKTTTTTTTSSANDGPATFSNILSRVIVCLASLSCTQSIFGFPLICSALTGCVRQNRHTCMREKRVVVVFVLT